MSTYIVYDRVSGDIVHRHRQDERVDATVGANRERILGFVKPSLDRSRLEILELPQDHIQPGKGYRVNPDTKTLEVVS